MAFENARKPLVLVVDDEVNTTIMLQYIFEREGYRVERVTDGPSALEAASSLLPDLILLDILLPRMNGFEVLARLKSNPITEHIPTILITANAREPSDVVQGLSLGADDYLYKPFAPQELLARVQSKMRARYLEDDLRRRSRELETLLAASEQLSQHLQRDQVIDITMQIVREHFPADQVLVYLHGDESNPPTRVMWSLIPDEELPVDDIAFAEAQLQDSCAASIWTRDADETRLSYNGMCACLQNSNQTVGTLYVFSKTSSYSEGQIRLLEGISRQAVMALRNAELYRLQAAYTQELEETIRTRTEELVSAHKLLVRNEKLAAIGQLAASIAHEINNPLMPIELLLEQLEDGLKAADCPVDLRDLAVVRENLLRIQRIVKSLLEYVRSDGELRQLDIGKLLEAASKLNRHHFEMERLHIQTELQDGLFVYGSKDQLEAVFMNLIINARAAMKPSGTLVIRAMEDGEDIVVEFEDDGSGIPPENLDKIFDPFFSTKQNGTGLGLFITYSVIGGHHGSITVRSEVGAGTCFTIRLPRSSQST